MKENEGETIKGGRSLATSGVNGEIEEGIRRKVPLFDLRVRPWPLPNDSSHLGGQDGERTETPTLTHTTGDWEKYCEIYHC